VDGRAGRYRVSLRCALGWLTGADAVCPERATATVHAGAVVAFACAPHAGLALLGIAGTRVGELPAGQPCRRRVTLRRVR